MSSLLRRFLDQSGFAEARVTLLAMGVCGAAAAAFMPWTRIGAESADATLFASGRTGLQVLRWIAVVAFGWCAWLGGSALRRPLSPAERRLGVLVGAVGGLAALSHLLDLRGLFVGDGLLSGIVHGVVGRDFLRPGVGVWMCIAAGALVAVKTLFATAVESETAA